MEGSASTDGAWACGVAEDSWPGDLKHSLRRALTRLTGPAAELVVRWVRSREAACGVPAALLSRFVALVALAYQCAVLPSCLVSRCDLQRPPAAHCPSSQRAAYKPDAGPRCTKARSLCTRLPLRVPSSEAQGPPSHSERTRQGPSYHISPTSVAAEPSSRPRAPIAGACYCRRRRLRRRCHCRKRVHCR